MIQPTHTTNQEADDDEDATSSSATSSDYDDEGLDDAHSGMPNISTMSTNDVSEAIYLQYRKAKRRWRKFTGRPKQQFRRKKRFNRRKQGRGRSTRKLISRSPRKKLYVHPRRRGSISYIKRKRTKKWRQRVWTKEEPKRT